MIDEDINERMARLVPQPGGIGEMPSQIPLGISMTPMVERPNAAPDIDTDYADAARRIADSRRTQMMSSLVNITAVDPDSAARSQKLGAQFGVGGDLAARNAEELRQRAFIDSISGRDMLRRNPVLADYIAQRQFAEIAHDDVDALAKTEQEFSKGWFARFDRPVSEVVSEGIAGIGEGFGRAVAQEEMASIYERQRQRGGRLEVYEKAALDSYREEMAKGGERTGFLEEAAYIGSQQLTGAPRIIEAGMMGATAGGGLGLVGGPAGFATVPAGMATGFAAGLAAGAFENSRRLETAMLYGELQPELGHESADRIATTVGIFNAALDTGAAALVAKPFAGLLRGAVRQKVSEAIRQQTTRAALANAAKAYGLGVAGEVGTEELQEINNVVGGELGRYLADKPMMIETEEGREAIATRLVDTFVATAMGMSIMGAPGPAGRLYVDTRAAKHGEQQAAKLQSMVKAIADNKLLARSPERLEEFAESAVEGTDSETTYVNAAVMHDILRQSGITEQEMDTVLPGVRAQLTEMQQNGIDLGNNDVTVPTAQMTVRLQKTPLLNQILPHARLSPDAMSITEVQEFEANRQQLVEQARQIMETRQETDSAFVAEAQAIEDRIFGELTAIGIEGMDERAARANAQFVRDMYVTMAARMNVSPAEVERRFPYRVQGEGMAAPAMLEQAVRPELIAQLTDAEVRELTDYAYEVGAIQSDLDALETELDKREVEEDDPSGGDDEPTRSNTGYGVEELVRDMAIRARAEGMTAEQLGALIRTSADLAIMTQLEPRPEVTDKELGQEAFAALEAHEARLAIMRERLRRNGDVLRQSGALQQASRIDADYLAAVERGDMEAAQRMVDEAARVQGQEAVTRDEQGNVVPLSRRFDITSPKLFEQAPVSPGFYSALAKAVNAVDAKSMAASGWKERIKGLVNKGEIKQDEVDWSGMTDWLDMQEGKVTKEAVAEFLKNNGVRVERVQLGEPKFGDRKLVLPGGENYREVLITLSAVMTPRAARQARLNELVEVGFSPIEAELIAEETASDLQSRVLQLQKQQEPYAANVAELVRIISATVGKASSFTMFQWLRDHPNKMEWRPQVEAWLDEAGSDVRAFAENLGWIKDLEEFQNFNAQITALNANRRGLEREQRGFRSGHWEEYPNVLVHFRLNDRVDADGKRVLFVEEIQSDWGQQGAEEGFANQRAADEEELARLLKKAEEAPSESLDKQIRRLRNRLEKGTYGLPVAPFVTKTDGWLNLGLKHILLEATQGNYDRVAFVNGKQSADRYDLSKTVNEITYNKNPDGTFNFQVDLLENQTDEFDRDNATLADVQQMFGKDVAEKMNAAKPKDVSRAKTQEQMFPRTIDNEGLKVGGSGMFEFYDNIVPLSVNKLLKKYGGKRLETIALGGEWDASAAEMQEWNEDRVRETLEAGGEVYVVFRGQETLIRDEDELEEYLDDVNNPTGWMFGDKLPTTTQSAFDVTPEMVKKLESGLPLFQAAAGPARGGFDPRRLTTILNKNADLSTFLHETAHFYLHVLGQMASDPAATPEIRADMDTLLSWFGIAGDTAEARLAAWNAMSIDQQRKYHEQFAYSFEVYLFDGKSPSVEMQGLFERFSSWLRRVYKSIRDDLNAIYRREFGEDLPILTGEVRQVMDRMLATEEQIKRQAALNEMKPQFQTLEQALASGMTEAEYAAYQVMQQEAMDAAVTDMTKASLRQMQWLGNARSRLLRDLQRKHDRQRKEVRDEVAEEIRLQPVYRAMEYLRTGTFVDSDGQSVKMDGPHRLDMEAVRNIYAGMPTPESLEAIRATGMAVPKNVAPDIAALGTGGKGMMGKDGIDPDVAAELFGYSSGDALIRALLAAPPMKDAIDARTDEVMLARFSDLVDQKARDAAVQTALHNEARARFVAVELRFVAKATQPTRVLIEAARQAAREMIAGKRIVDVKPQEFIAAESRAARDAADLGKYEAQAKITGKAEYDRVRLAALAAGSTEEDAVRVAEEAQAAFVAARTAEREAEFKARFGASTVQQALIRAKRAQLYQNQLAAEALRVREEVDKDVKYLRRVLRDENVKRMGADSADQVRAILSNYSLALMTRAQQQQVADLRTWLAKAEADGTLLDIDPSLADSARRQNYTELTVNDFRELVESVKLIEYRGKNERNIYLAGQKLIFEEMRDGVVASMTEVAEKKGRKVRKELGDEDRKWMNNIASYDASQQTIGNIVYVLDGGKRDGPLAMALLMPANDAGNQEAKDRAVISEKVNAIVGPLAQMGQFAAPKMYFPHIDESLSLEQRMVVALNYGNQSNIDRLLNGEKWTADQARVIIQSLTEEQLNAVQAIWDVMSSFRDRVAEKSRRLTGKEPRWLEPLPMRVTSADGKIVELRGGYYPAKYNPRRSVGARELDIAADAERLQREAYTATTTSRSFEKNRSDRPPVDQVLSRQFVGMYAGLNEVIHDLAWHDFAISATRLLRDKSFQRVIKERYGLETYNAIKDWVDVVVAGDRTKYDAFEQIAIFARQNVSVAAMGIRLMTAAVQPTGIFPAMTRTGIRPMVRAIAEFAYSPVATSRNVVSRSDFMQNRGRTRFRDLNEIANIVQEQSRFQRVRRTYIASAYVFTSFVQGLVDTSVWMAAYSNAIKAGKSEKEAVFVADQTVIDTQGSGRVQDLSSAMRGGKKQSAYAKLFTPFYQYSNTMYSLFGAQMRTAPTYGKAAKDAFLILTVGAIVEELIREALRPSPEEPEPEELLKKLAANQIDFVVGLPFGVREFRGAGSLIVGTEEGVQAYRGPSGLRVLTDATKAAVQARQGEFNAAFRREMINLLGTTVGIPSAQINDTINGIEALSEGETENPLAPLTGVKR